MHTRDSRPWTRVGAYSSLMPWSSQTSSQACSHMAGAIRSEYVVFRPAYPVYGEVIRKLVDIRHREGLFRSAASPGDAQVKVTCLSKEGVEVVGPRLVRSPDIANTGVSLRKGTTAGPHRVGGSIVGNQHLDGV